MRSTAIRLQDLSADCFARSKLLLDLRSTAEETELTLIPLNEDAFQLWVQHVQEMSEPKSEDPAAQAVDTASRTGTSSTLALYHRTSGASHTEAARPHTAPGERPGAAQDDAIAAAEAGRLCLLMLAADVLIDDDTRHSAVVGLSTLLLKANAGIESDVADKVSQTLLEHLVMTVLNLSPLAHSIRHLPTTCHPSALRAHHPSIDTHKSLHLLQIPPDSMQAALAAASTMSRIQSLSLAGATLPRACRECIAAAGELSYITALSLQDVGLADEASAALATVLPAMPQLRRLDLSRNSITDNAAASLEMALRECLMLQSLDISAWDVEGLTVRGSMGVVAQHAVRAVVPLRQLQSLSFGISTAGSVSSARKEGFPILDHIPELLEAVCGMPALQELQLWCPGLAMPAQHAQRTADLLALAPQLTQLHLALPHFSVGSQESSLGGNGDDAPTEADVLCRAVGHFTRLVSLELSLGDMHDDAAAALAESVSALPSLCQLRILPSAGATLIGDRLTPALAQVLPRMPTLTQLHAFAGRRSGVRQRPARLSADSFSLLVAAVAAATQLRELWMPLCKNAGGVVGKLLGATHLTTLQVDLHVAISGSSQHTTHDMCSALVPMLPHVVDMVATCWDSRTRFQIQPISAAAGALRQLRTLSVMCALPVRFVAADVQGLLNNVSCMCSLVELTLEFTVRHWHVRGERRVPVPLELGPFCSGLIAIAGVTNIQWGVKDTEDRHMLKYQQDVLRACGFLTGLRSLKLGVLRDEACAEFAAAVPWLPLRFLKVVVSSGVVAECVAGVIRQLPQLREARVVTDSNVDTHRVLKLRAAAESLPACDLRN